MAAIFCKGIFSCCSNMCDGCSNCCGSMCEGCCKGLAECCTNWGNVCCNPEKPFPYCTTFTWFISFIPSIVFLIYAGEHWNNSCGSNLPLWLLITAILFIVNMIFSAYLYWRFTLRSDEKTNALNRGVKILCYDPIVCLYFFVWAFEIAWSIIGIVWISSYTCQNGVETLSTVAVVLMFVYCILGVMIALCSVCCQCCKEGVNELNKK